MKSHLLRTGIKTWLTFSITADLSGCYFVNQPAFESSVNKRVSIGMPLTTATKNLRVLGLSCDAGDPVDCSRVRQRLWPPSCVERVKLIISNSYAASAKGSGRPKVASGGVKMIAHYRTFVDSGDADSRACKGR
jgi:hypothetical protein